MSPTERQKLFSRFAQANAKTSVKYGGTGLGLFISKRLTEKLNGEIGVFSDLGHGSTFVFYVEAHRTQPEPETSAVIEQKLPLAVRTMSGPINGMYPAGFDTHMHVLLVEDNELNQKIVAKQLTKAGCIVEVANNGVEALQRIKKTDLWHENTAGKRIDIILMDWEMPLMDGITCCQEIRSLERDGKLNRHMQIIVTTANARDDQVEYAIANGGDAVIAKPFLVSALLNQMKARLAASSATESAGVVRTFSEP